MDLVHHVFVLFNNLFTCLFMYGVLIVWELSHRINVINNTFSVADSIRFVFGVSRRQIKPIWKLRLRVEGGFV